MRIFIDEDIPNELSPLLRAAGHEVTHVEDAGLKGIPNGALLPIISDTYDIFVTGDTNLRFQQNLRKYDFAIILLRRRLLVIEQIKPLISHALAAMAKGSEARGDGHRASLGAAQRGAGP